MQDTTQATYTTLTITSSRSNLKIFMNKYAYINIICSVKPFFEYCIHSVLDIFTTLSNLGASPEHSSSIFVRFICKDSLIHASMSWRLRLSLVTEVEYTFTAMSYC